MIAWPARVGGLGADETGPVRWRLPGVARHAAEQPEGGTFEAVILPHLDAAHNLARWLVRDANLAEDVVQDGVVRALSYFATFRGGDGRAWLMRIVRNVAYTALASRQPGPLPEDLPELPDPADNPEMTLARRQAVASMEQALAALPVELRECLVLRELEELSYKDIAHVVGLPVGTVMSRLWRARQALMRMPVEGPDQ